MRLQRTHCVPYRSVLQQMGRLERGLDYSLFAANICWRSCRNINSGSERSKQADWNNYLKGIFGQARGTIMLLGTYHARLH